MHSTQRIPVHCTVKCTLYWTSEVHCTISFTILCIVLLQYTILYIEPYTCIVHLFCKVLDCTPPCSAAFENSDIFSSRTIRMYNADLVAITSTVPPILHLTVSKLFFQPQQSVSWLFATASSHNNLCPDCLSQVPAATMGVLTVCHEFQPQQ